MAKKKIKRNRRHPRVVARRGMRKAPARYDCRSHDAPLLAEPETPEQEREAAEDLPPSEA